MCSADSIEANVESADMNVQRGTQQLARAADYQVKHNRSKERQTDRNSKRGRGGGVNW